MVQPHASVMRYWLCALLFSTGALLGMLVARYGFLNYPELPHLGPLFAHQADAAQDSLLLQVNSEGTDLRVRWNRSATAIARAEAGSLSIRDGDNSPKELRLDAVQLHTGSVLYSAGSDRVQFSLKLFEPDGQSVSDYVLAVSPLRRPASGNDTDSTISVSTAKMPSTSLDSTPAGADPLPEVRKAMVGANRAAAAQTLPSSEQSSARARTTNGNLVSGEVVRQMLPDVPTKARRSLKGTLHVRVRVRVDPSGSVTDATLDSPGPSKYFAGLALQAARSWKFAPKRDGGDVSNEWVLRFEFRRTATRVLPERAAL